MKRRVFIRTTVFTTLSFGVLANVAKELRHFTAPQLEQKSYKKQNQFSHGLDEMFYLSR